MVPAPFLGIKGLKVLWLDVVIKVFEHAPVNFRVQTVPFLFLVHHSRTSAELISKNISRHCFESGVGRTDGLVVCQLLLVKKDMERMELAIECWQAFLCSFLLCFAVSKMPWIPQIRHDMVMIESTGHDPLVSKSLHIYIYN